MATPYTDAAGVFRLDFDSVTDAIEAVPAALGPTGQTEVLRNHGKKFARGSDNWLDHRTPQWLRDRAVHADPTLVTEIESMARDLADLALPDAMPIVRRRRVRGQDMGDEMCSDRYLARIPQLWERMDRLVQPTRAITIAVNQSISGSCVRADLLPRGAAVAAMADLLSKRGFSVRVVAFFSTDVPCTGVQTACGTVTIKPHDMPMSLDAIATGLAEIAFARAAVLCTLMHALPAPHNAGMGRVCRLQPSVAQAEGIALCADTDIMSKSAAIQWIQDAAKKIDVASKKT